MRMAKRKNDQKKKEDTEISKVESPPTPTSPEAAMPQSAPESSGIQINKAVMLSLDLLEPNESNVNEMGQEELSQLAKMIQRNGFDEPLQVVKRNEKYIVMGGNHRWKVAKLLNMPEVPCVIYDWDERRSMEECVKRNMVRGHPNFDKFGAVLATYLKGQANFDWKQVCDAFAVKESDILKAIKSNEALKGLTQSLKSPDDTLPEEAPEGEEPITKSGDLWTLGKHRLLCGDPVNENDYAMLMGDRKAFVINTLPTSGVDLNAVFVNCSCYSLPNAAWYIWCSGFKQLMEVVSILGIIEIIPKQHIIWRKIPGSKGNFYPTSHEAAVFAFKDSPPQRDEKIYYNPEHEEAIFSVKKGEKPPAHMEKGTLTSVWDIPYTGKDRPTRLYEIPMFYHVEAEGICLEPFAGHGAQIMAGERVGRSVYALEKNPRLVDYCVKRFLLYNNKDESKIQCNRKEAVEEILERLGDKE